MRFFRRAFHSRQMIWKAVYVRLAGARGHDEQDAVPPLGDGLDRRVDRVDLVVPRRLAAGVLEIVLENGLFGFRRQALPGSIALPQRGR